MPLNVASLTIDSLADWLNAIKKDLAIDAEHLASTVRLGLPPQVPVAHLLTFAAEAASSLVSRHPDWGILGGRILQEELKLSSPDRFSTFVDEQRSIFQSEFVNFVAQHRDCIDSQIDHSQDLPFTFFAIRTLRASYLHEGERLQYLWMRVALAIHMPDLDAAFDSYRLMSQRYFIHASPTLFNAGCKNGQLASCFLLAMKNSSIEGIFDTLKQCAMISHQVGGIGLHCSNIPSARSLSNKASSSGDGLIPMLRIFNNAARFVTQGSNRRPGAISITLEPWHADVFEFLDLRKNYGKEENRARDLFLALWIPDLFMQKVRDDEDWCLFNPTDAPGLQDVYGVEFEALYKRYEADTKYVARVPARKLWGNILDAQVETGNPSLLYKDSCNIKSNQKNLGTIKSSNLCTEIIEYSSEDEIAVCNLASLGLPRFVSEDGNRFNFQKLHDVVKVVIRNLNRTIDRNIYPLAMCKVGNLKHRPLALGVQGLADVFFKMQIPFDSLQANELNRKIFETIYHGSLEASVELAKQHGSPYESFEGSPIQQGKLQFDLWNTKVSDELWNWTALRASIAKHGVYNSLLTSVMPTASTSQILGYTESIEPLTSNIYTRRTLSGEFQVVNAYMVKDLIKLGLWNEEIREEIIAQDGSIQQLRQAPAEFRALYKTAWELSMKAVIDQSVGRAPFIDQSQSLNLFLSQPTRKQLTSMHFNAWSRGLKTGIYYLRTQPAASPIPFTVSHETRKRVIDSAESSPAPTPKKSCSYTDAACDSCS